MSLADRAFEWFVANHKPKPDDVFIEGGLAQYVELLKQHGGRRVEGSFAKLSLEGCRPGNVAWLALLCVAAAAMRAQMQRRRQRSKRSGRDAAAEVRKIAERLAEVIEAGAVTGDPVVHFIKAGKAATVALTASDVPSLVERLAVAIDVNAAAIAAPSNPRFWDRTQQAEGWLLGYVKRHAQRPMGSDVAEILRATRSLWAEDVGDRSYTAHTLLVRHGRQNSGPHERSQARPRTDN